MSAYKKPILALIFVALLAAPVILRHYRRQMPAAPAGADSRAQYGFRMTE